MSDELNMSSVTADPAPETAGKRAAPEEKPPKTPGKRAGLIIGIAAAVLVLAYAGCCVAANALYSHTAFPNTSVLGMDMSGLSAQEAEQRWTEQGSALLDGMTIRLTRDGQEIGSTTRLCLQGCRLRRAGPGLGQRCDRVPPRRLALYRELVQGRGCHAPAGRGRGEAYRRL